MSWVKAMEKVLSDYSTNNSSGKTISYDAIRMNEDDPNLPDKYIVYTFVEDKPTSFYDGKPFTSQPLVTVSVYSRTKTDIIEFPEDLLRALVDAGFSKASTVILPFNKETGHYGITQKFYFYEMR